MPILGLMSSASLTATQSENARRKIFFQYPNGAFTLMGLLSMMKDGETLDKPSFGWWEERYKLPNGKTAMANAAGPWTTTSGANGAPGVDLTSGGWSQALETTIRLKVVDATLFQVRDTVWIQNNPGTASSLKQIYGQVVAVWTAQNTIDIRVINVAVSNALNDTTVNGLYVLQIGNAAAEGDRSRSGAFKFPIEPYNQTQIYRTAVGPFTRTSLKMGQRFDKTGMYKKTAKDQMIRHMTGMEQSLYWGKYYTSTVVNDNGDTVPERHQAGLYDMLTQYEIGNVSNGGRFDYRVGGSDLTSLTWNGDDEKRILLINGTVTKNQFDDIIRRIFFYNSDTSWEKLVVCGGGFLAAFNRFAEANSIKVVDLRSDEDSYGMQITAWETVYGTLYFKSHPLFTHHPQYNYSAFVVDVGSLLYHPLADSDTTLLRNRQNNDEDGRKDEWLTEMGVEIQYPERHAYIGGLTGITT